MSAEIQLHPIVHPPRIRDLAVAWVAPAVLKPSPLNPRTHDRRQRRQMEHVLRTVGFVNPIVTDSDNTVLAGHLRLDAAIALGLAEVPVIRVKTRDKCFD